jgi:hypothetical protein
MQYESWTINEIRDGETVEVAKGASRDDAVRAIRAAMYGTADFIGTPGTDSVHELPLAA